MGQQGVVVQHLLEVRRQPVGIGAVAGEAAAQLVVDAAVRHPVEGDGHHPERRLVPVVAPTPKEELQGHGGRKLGRRTESAMRGVEAGRQASNGLIELSRFGGRATAIDGHLLPQVSRQLSWRPR